MGANYMKVIRFTIRMSLLALLVAVIFTACSLQRADEQTVFPDGAYATASVFQRFYNKNGGLERFGHAISTSYTNQRGEIYQFFETVLMVYDPIEDIIYFDDLGNQLEMRSLLVQDWSGPVSQDGLTVGKFYIPPTFTNLYLELGPDQVGAPLTEAYFNFSNNRMEQHYANMGFYYDLDDPEQTVKLLNYGEAACESCSLALENQKEGIVDLPATTQSYRDAMRVLNISVTNTGESLKGPLAVKDSSTELVFEYMALTEKDSVFSIRPLPRLLGMDDPNLYYPLNLNSFVFYEIKNGTGHNVLKIFDTYIRENGGYQVSGAPITEIIEPDAGMQALRQCFENYCLDYFPYVEGPQVRPTPLGDRYLAMMEGNYVSDADPAGDENGNEDFSTQPRNVNPFTLLLWEGRTVVDSNTAQTIYVVVELENTPQTGKELVLTVEYPDGRVEQMLMPATAADGSSTYTLAPIQGENGDLVYYEACLYVQSGVDPACVEQSFMIWGNP